MSGPDEGPFRVKVAGQELRVDSVQALADLVRSGQLGGASLVLPPGGTEWIAADKVPGVAAGASAGADPWDAWEDMDEDPDTADQVVEEFEGIPAGDAAPPRAATPDVAPPATLSVAFTAGGEQEDVDDFDTDASETTDPGIVPSPRRGRTPAGPEQLPTSAMKPLEDAGGDRSKGSSGPRTETLPSLNPPRPRGKVIAFPPQSPTPSVSGATALAPAETIPLPRRPRKPKPQRAPPDAEAPPDTGTRWGRLAVMGVFGLVGLMGVKWYVDAESGATFVAPTAVVSDGSAQDPIAATVGVEDPDLAPVPEDGSQEAAGEFSALETELRDRLAPGLQPVATDREFADALYIEINRVGVNVDDVRVRVDKWVGKKRDVPGAAHIQVRFRSRGELDRELGGIALVVGKYAHRLHMDDLDVYEATRLTDTEVVHTTVLKGEDSARYFTQKLSLEEFLQAVVAGQD